MMRVRFRSYCYGCRHGWVAGDGWHTRYASHRTGHRWEWEYWIHIDGYRLIQRTGFATFDRAGESAKRAYGNLRGVMGAAYDVAPGWGVW